MKGPFAMVWSKSRTAALSLSVSLLAGLGLAGCAGVIAPVDDTPVNVRLIAMNDFHGNIEAPASPAGSSVVVADPAHPGGTKIRAGGAAYLATLVKTLKAGHPNSILVGAGDMIGASPFTSNIAHDEPTVDILSRIGLEVSSVGNHEFDKGKAELLRIQNGGCYPGDGKFGVVGRDTCLIDGRFPGAAYRYLAANVVDTGTGRTLFPPTYVKQFGPVKVGFIGLTLKDTPSVVTPSGVAGLSFQDEASTINAHAARLRAQGVQAIVVLIHQGGQTTATTINDHSCPGLSGDILPIVDALSKDVDMVVSGHTHQEYVCRRNGKLLTQTGLYGDAVTRIDLSVSPRRGVIEATADTIPVVNGLNTELPAGHAALAKDPEIDAAVQRYVALSAAIKNVVEGSITASILRFPGGGGQDQTIESPLGDLVADASLFSASGADFPAPAQIAFVNPGGLRNDLVYFPDRKGEITYGDLFAVIPFHNHMVAMDLTGRQIVRLLEQQWEKPNDTAGGQGAWGSGRLLQVSRGFSYAWDSSKPAGADPGQGDRVIPDSLTLNGAPMDLDKTYRIAVNDFMASGGDNFTVCTRGRNRQEGGLDIDGFVDYFHSISPVSPPAANRVTRK